jgi:hypothetical protein
MDSLALLSWELIYLRLVYFYFAFGTFVGI